MYIREDQADVRVTVNGKPFGDTWATYSGGGLTAADAKTRSGGMGKNKSVGGPADRGDVTVEIQMDDVVVGWHNELESYVGRQDIVLKVAVQYLNPDKSLMAGASFTRTGTVKTAALADTNQDSGDVGMYQLVGSMDELAA